MSDTWGNLNVIKHLNFCGLLLNSLFSFSGVLSANEQSLVALINSPFTDFLLWQPWSYEMNVLEWALNIFCLTWRLFNQSLFDTHNLFYIRWKNIFQVNPGSIFCCKCVVTLISTSAICVWLSWPTRKPQQWCIQSVKNSFHSVMFFMHLISCGTGTCKVRLQSVAILQMYEWMVNHRRFQTELKHVFNKV